MALSFGALLFYQIGKAFVPRLPKKAGECKCFCNIKIFAKGFKPSFEYISIIYSKISKKYSKNIQKFTKKIGYIIDIDCERKMWLNNFNNNKSKYR